MTVAGAQDSAIFFVAAVGYVGRVIFKMLGQEPPYRTEARQIASIFLFKISAGCPGSGYLAVLLIGPLSGFEANVTDTKAGVPGIVSAAFRTGTLPEWAFPAHGRAPYSAAAARAAVRQEFT